MSNNDPSTIHQESITHVSNTALHPTPLVQPYRILLKDGVTNATIYPVYSPNEISSTLLEFLWDEYNMEIEKGETLTFYNPLSFDDFINHWFSGSIVVAIMIVGDEPDLTNDERQWPSELLGVFNIKPNYPGERSSHICTGEFLVNAGIRGRGIGKTLTDCYIQWCGDIGYKYIIFNMVLETNVAARKLYESLNFERVGKIKDVAYMGNEKDSVDGIIYGRTINDETRNISSSVSVTSSATSSTATNDADINNLKFENLLYYLRTGKYPKNADSKEKSRLRANKASYYLDEEGRLILNGKEVITVTNKQLEVCQLIHEENGHLGINRTTTLVSQKYHWIRIKETVAKVIKSCQECKNNALQDRMNQPSSKRIKLMQQDLEKQILEQEKLEAAVAQVKQRLEDGISYADAARSAFVNESDGSSKGVQPEVRTYFKEESQHSLLTSVKTYR